MAMIVKSIDISKLYISDLNVRKTSTSIKDESNIEDLANDIKSNGLINPITVTYNDNKDTYEIIAGSRRYKAMVLLKSLTIPCNIINVALHKAEEISLVENINRNQMTTYDKVKAFAKLSDVCEDNIDSICKKVNISKATIQKYLKIKDLPEELLKLLDTKNNEHKKISVDLALQLVNYKKQNHKLDVIELFNLIEDTTNSEKIETLEKYIKYYNEKSAAAQINSEAAQTNPEAAQTNSEAAQTNPEYENESENEYVCEEEYKEEKEKEKEKEKTDINNIKEQVKTQNTNSKNWSNQNKKYKFLDPYVIDKKNNEVIIIPASMYEEIVELIKLKTGGNPCTLKL
jgi:ParB/RepB/Spo0J family partition protein